MSSSSISNPQSAIRILIVRMGSMGDIIHTLPAAASLRRAFPDAQIDWLVEEQWAALLEGNPHLSAVRKIHLRGGRGVLRSLGELRSRGYDCALDFQGLIKSAVIARLSGAREVTGFRMKALREKSAAAFYHRHVAAEGDHVVEQNLALARAAGAKEMIVEFPLPHGRESAAADERVARLVAPLGEFFALSPSAGWAAKRWPPVSFAQLIQRAEMELGLRAAVNCGPGEEALAFRVAELARPARPQVVVGGILELVALVRQARAFVAGDTGPLHVAAAAGTPVVAIFGPTSPERNGPYSRRARVLRAPGVVNTYSRSESNDAVARVTVDQAFAALAGVIQPA